MEIKTVGVVGCGTMGAGIVHICARAGYKVIVAEANDALLKKGISTVEGQYNDGVKRGKMTQAEKDTAFANISGTTDLAAFKDVDLVIEAIIENLQAKQELFIKLDKICPPATIFASNTSCLSLIHIAGKTSRKEKVVGTHFFNPVYIMKLCEVVRSIATSDETVAIIDKFGKSVGKTVCIAKDTPGLMTSRLGMIQGLEAIRMVEEGVGTPAEIDSAMKLGYGLPMGPLELGDLVGLDVRLDIALSLYEMTKDAKWAPPILMQKMVAAGWTGKKAGKGFYNYDRPGGNQIK